MAQQINLYRQLPQRKEPWLTTKLVLWSYGGFLILLILLQLSGLRQKHNLNIEEDKLNIAVSSAQQELLQLVQQYPFTDQESLKKNLIQLKEEYAKKDDQLDLLTHYANFSNYLIGLGETIVPGVWLTEITLSREEINIGLKGYALQPAFLDDFFARLIASPIFKRLTFKVNEIKQIKFPASFYITA